MSEEGRVDLDKNIHSNESVDQDGSVESRKDPKLEDNSDSSRDISNWIRAVEMYVKETNVRCLQFTNSIINIPFEAVESILQFLPDSEVTELILHGICCPPQKIQHFFELLKKTKVEKLETINCFSSCGELLDLAKILNDTKIIDWNTVIYSSHLSHYIKGKELVSCLFHSRLTKLTLYLTDYVSNRGALSFVEGLSNTSLTCLRIVYSRKEQGPSSIMASLLSQLPVCKIRELDLSRLYICYDLIKELSRNLATSSIEMLSLEFNDIEDAGLDVLAQGLVNSNLSVLNVPCNRVTGLNNFGHYLKNTKIKVLNLGFNRINNSKMFAFPNFLKDSLVESLDISKTDLSDELLAELIRSLKSSKVSFLNLSYSANFGINSLSELASVLKETGLEDINICAIDLPLKTFDILCGCIKQSKLKHIKFTGPKESTAMSIFRFIEGIKNSSVLSIDMQFGQFYASHADLFVGALMHSTFTRLNLSYSKLGYVFNYLAVNLKDTSITHLDLSFCDLQDEHIQLLAENLRETKIVELNLSGNAINKEGLIALRCCPQTSVIHLLLDTYEIEDDCLEILAKNFTGSLITTVRVVFKRRSRFFLIEKVLVENRVRSLKLVAFFKLVFPENGNGNFCFRQCMHDSDVSAFLEECLQFHKIIVEQPAVISVLLQEQSLSFSREELRDLLENKFPRQFLEFISNWVVADVSQQVNLLKRAEQLGLDKMVKNLLLLRPLYTIDEAEGILHPIVYPLLHKYKRPICNIEIDPSGISRITGYFKKHFDLEGAVDVIKLLEPEYFLGS